MAEITIWVADLDVDAATASSLREVLDAQEQARADRFAFEHLRRRFVVAHAMLRHVLGPDVALVVGEHGKPATADGAVRFNLSHSGERALLAVREGVDVGVDTEQVRAMSYLDAMAERVMSPDELARFRAAADRNRCFLDTWVAKESVLKATGEGITRRLQELDVATCGLRVVPLDVGAGYVAAVASEGDDWDVELREWRGG